MSPSDTYSISFFEDLMSRLAAARPGWWRWLAGRETNNYADQLENRPIDRPVYITGLARSGTTLLLECLAAHEQAATHRYRDYPFVHIPVWWNRALDRSGAREGAPVERFHQDRMFITSQSPEAMEEPLWMAFFPKCHLPFESHVLDAGDTHPVFEDFYRAHIRKILFLRHGSRYVAKANYHVTRLGYLKHIFSDARFIIPVRSPAGHIASLLRQHRHFCDQEQKDRRVLNHMRRAGHFEFGLDRRPINVGDQKAVDRILQLWAAGQDVHGLALVWRSVYQHVIACLSEDSALRASTLLLSYDDLCRAPEDYLRRIYAHCELAISDQLICDQAAGISARSYYTPDFSDQELSCINGETGDVYERLLRMMEQQDDSNYT